MPSSTECAPALSSPRPLPVSLPELAAKKPAAASTPVSRVLRAATSAEREGSAQQLQSTGFITRIGRK